MIYLFEDISLDTDRRELRRGSHLIGVEPQVFDILNFLVANRARVVSKDDLLRAIWNGRAVSESALSSRITAVRHAIGDSGAAQRLIRTIARKGLRFVGDVREAPHQTSETPRPVPENGEIPLASAIPGSGPERRQITIAACDIFPSHGPAPALDAEDFGEVLATVRGRIECEAERQGGMVVQQVTGRYLVCFGYPQAHEDDAERAIRAGLAIVEAIGGIEFPCLDGALRPRVGIATGVVVIGDSTGGDSATLAAIAGDAPHIAERALEAARPGTVAVSLETRRLVGRLFEFAGNGVPERSGESADISRVVRESGLGSRFEALRSAGATFVGREEEFELLMRRWRQAKAGEGRSVLIWGEPGIGKSRLVAELEEAIGREKHAALRFHCAPHRTQTALHPVVEHMERAAEFAPDDSNERKLAKLERLFSSTEQAGSDTRLFAELLSIPASDGFAIPALSPQRRRELVMQRFLARLAAAAARDPVLMVLEDAHWMDTATRDLFDMVMDRVRDLPIMLIVTYRPEFSPPWLGPSHVTAIMLNRLDRRDNAALIKSLAGDVEVPAALLGHIVDRTDGVPLFTEELTKSVLESDAMRKAVDGLAPPGAAQAVSVPATLQASLAARFDRLAAVRTVMQTGAALGREFEYKVLRAVLRLEDEKLRPLLDQLVASGLVLQRGAPPDALYTFKHALVQDAAYQTLLKRQRRKLHASTKAVLETEFPETVRRHPDVLAHHCAEAELWRDAIEYGIDAARVALHRCAPIEAQALVEKSIALAPRITDQTVRRQLDGRLQLALADCLVMTKGFASPEVAAAFSRGRSLLEGSARSVDALKALCGLFNYHLMRSEAPSGLRLVEPFLRRSLQPPKVAVVRFLAGAAQLHIGNFPAARRNLEASLDSYEAGTGGPVDLITGYHLRSFTLVWLSLAQLYLGDLDRAAKTIEAAVRDARSRSHPFTLVSALLAQARFLNHKRDLEGAIKATEEGFAIATEQRSPYHVSRASILRAVNLIHGGHPEEGAALMERALAEHRGTGANFQSSFNLSHLALAYAKMRNFPRAVDTAVEAVAEVARSGELWWEAEAQRIRGEILSVAAPRHRSGAEACLRQAIRSARRQKARFWELRAVRSLASLHGAAKCPVAVREELANVHARFAKGAQWSDVGEVGDFLNGRDRPNA